MSDPIDNTGVPPGASPDNEHAAPPTTQGEGGVEPAEADLAQVLAETQAKAQENYDLFLRAKAETDTIRRRAAEDVLKAQKFGVEKMADALLAVKDSMDAALVVENVSVESFKTGVELTARQLSGVFEKFSIREINPLGEKFDPNKHQAISTMESEQEPNTVVNVLQKGYALHDRILRPALVSVARKKNAG